MTIYQSIDTKNTVNQFLIQYQKRKFDPKKIKIADLLVMPGLSDSELYIERTIELPRLVNFDD